MNERILELARQAVNRQTVGASDMANWEVINRFAELIILECCDQVRYVDAVEIKEHFGMK